MIALKIFRFNFKFKKKYFKMNSCDIVSGMMSNEGMHILHGIVRIIHGHTHNVCDIFRKCVFLACDFAQTMPEYDGACVSVGM